MTRDQVEKLAAAMAAESPEFKAAWDAAAAAVDMTQTDTGAMLQAMDEFDLNSNSLSEDGVLSEIRRQWELSAEQDAKAAVAPPRKGKLLHDQVDFGKPLLITASGAGVLSMAKEVAWKLGGDPQVVAADPMLDETMFEAEFRATSSGGVVILDELHRAGPEVRLKALELMKDPDRRVIVAVPGKPLPELPPEAFAHWAKF